MVKCSECWIKRDLILCREDYLKEIEEKIEESDYDESDGLELIIDDLKRDIKLMKAQK